MLWGLPVPDYRCARGDRAVLGKRPRQWLRQEGSWLALKWGCKVLNVWYEPWWGWSVFDLITFVGTEVRDVIYFPELGAMMKRRSVGAAAEGSKHTHLAPVESDILSSCPNVIAHCAVTRYDDGTPRQPGWVTVKTMGSAWVLEAKDPDAAARVTATGDSLDNALALLELLLGAEEAPWESDPWLRQRSAKSKKGA